MKCKHCGKELMAVTMYVEASTYGQPHYKAAAPAGYVPVPISVDETTTIAFPNAAAAAGCMPFSFTTYCNHEPDVTGERVS